MQVEIYVVKTEISGKNLNPEKLAQLSAVKDEISKNCGGLSILPEFRGEWWENGVIYEDITEIWRILATNEQPIDFSWLRAKIDQIKAITNQKSQLYTTNPQISAFFR